MSATEQSTTASSSSKGKRFYLASVIILDEKGKWEKDFIHEERLDIHQDEGYTPTLMGRNLYLQRNGKAKFLPSSRSPEETTNFSVIVSAFTVIHRKNPEEPPLIVVFKRGRGLYHGKWAMPALHVEIPYIEETALRAVEEDTGKWDGVEMSYNGTIAIKDSVPSDGVHNIAIFYYLSAAVEGTIEEIRAKMTPRQGIVEDIFLVTLDELKASTDEGARQLQDIFATMHLSQDGVVSWD